MTRRLTINGTRVLITPGPRTIDPNRRTSFSMPSRPAAPTMTRRPPNPKARIVVTMANGAHVLLTPTAPVPPRIPRGMPGHPCEQCGQDTKGYFLRNGWERCHQCGYPSQ